jgi:YD repeat-containing protein
MKNIGLICLLVLLWACQKDGEKDVLGPLPQLQRVTQNGKVREAFKYENGNLVSERYFYVCETNPSDEVSYIYQNGVLKNDKQISRMHFSSTFAHCNPEMGERFSREYVYNAQGKLSLIKYPLHDIELVYNAQNRVEAIRFKEGERSQTLSTFRYDERGNIIEERDSRGQLTTYTYDNKHNPYYLMRQRPYLLNAFNGSPNNVISGKGAQEFTRRFQYNDLGLPISVEEISGEILRFEYQ